VADTSTTAIVSGSTTNPVSRLEITAGLGGEATSARVASSPRRRPGNSAAPSAGPGTLAVLDIVSYSDTMAPARKQLSLVERIFQEPPPADVRWTEVRSLLSALGAEITEGRGSRVRLFLNGVRAVFHRPHPRSEMDRGAVRSLRRFLREAGVGPEE